MTAKEKSTNYRRFVERHGSDAVFELEALDPADLQSIVTEAIEAVIDSGLYNDEVDAEAHDAAFLDGVRNTVHDALSDMDWEEDDE